LFGLLVSDGLADFFVGVLWLGVITIGLVASCWYTGIVLLLEKQVEAEAGGNQEWHQVSGKIQMLI
jgi:hypothetical protein